MKYGVIEISMTPISLSHRSEMAGRTHCAKLGHVNAGDNTT